MPPVAVTLALGRPWSGAAVQPPLALGTDARCGSLRDTEGVRLPEQGLCSGSTRAWGCRWILDNPPLVAPFFGLAPALT